MSDNPISRETYINIGMSEPIINGRNGIGFDEAFREITSRPTFNKQMEDLSLACGRLGLVLMEATLKFVLNGTIRFLRFWVWLNG